MNSCSRRRSFQQLDETFGRSTHHIGVVLIVCFALDILAILIASLWFATVGLLKFYLMIDSKPQIYKGCIHWCQVLDRFFRGLLLIFVPKCATCVSYRFMEKHYNGCLCIRNRICWSCCWGMYVRQGTLFAVSIPIKVKSKPSIGERFPFTNLD